MSVRVLEPIYRDVGRRIAAFRLLRGMSAEQVAVRIGCTRAAISLVETGQSRLMLHTAFALAEVFGVTLGELLTGPAPEVDAIKARLACDRLERRRQRLAKEQAEVEALLAELRPQPAPEAA